MHTFNTPNPVHLRVELWVGEVDITAADTDTTTVELTPLHGDPSVQEIIDAAKVEQRGDHIIVQLPKAKGGLFRRSAEVLATITVPTDSAAKVETASADINTRGQLGDTKAYSGSGDIQLDRVADAEVRTGSGDIAIANVRGSCDTKSGSAEVTIGPVGGDADVISGSGDVVIDSVGGTLKVKSGSGDIVVKHGGESVDAMAGSGDLLIKRVDHGRLKAKTGSGDIQVGVAHGTAAYLDIMTVTGDVKSELDGTDAPSNGEQTVEIHVQTGTGDVVLQRA